MEKPTLSDGSLEPQCVGRLEIVRPKPVGFLCGTLPVPMDNAFHAFNSDPVPAPETASAPRYRMLPTETDLNTAPCLSYLPDKVLPIASGHSKASGDIPWESAVVAPNLRRKGEALAVSGLVEHGDEIDVIAPVDILKQIFKIPYSKAQLSIAVHRIGQTLVMNTGPDIDKGENFVKRHNSQPKCADQSLFLKFAMHSVRMEACDCPPTHQGSSEEQSKPFVFPGLFESRNVATQSFSVSQEDGFHHSSHYPKVKQDKSVWRSKKNKSYKGCDTVTELSQIGEKHGRSVQESEKYKRHGKDEFLRVLFWQFHNFRMLLGSDLLIFSDEKFAAVSLHLWDVTQQVTPLTWLEAWLDNVMASVPELAICYHKNGVVQGYELLKTNDIFLLKGISDDGTPAFHPYAVQQNGLSVLRFLQENCKQDPAPYWLYKSSGDDVLQLFDLSVITKNHSPSDCDDNSTSLPSLIHQGRSDSLLSLGSLLFRIAHRLSLSMSMAPNSKAKCAILFKKCLDCLDEPDHLVVRASAHEQFARLLLNCKEELDSTSEPLPPESDVKVIDAEEEFPDLFSGISKSIADEDVHLEFNDKLMNEDETFDDSVSDDVSRLNLEVNIAGSRKLIASEDLGVAPSSTIDPKQFVQTNADKISSNLAAVHHISQAIKSLRWRRQLQCTEAELADGCPAVKNLLVCACGDADCIEVCDIREWLPTSKLDHKLWKLILLLGESYLALGQAYKVDGQLHQALRVVEVACLVYGSMPQHLEDARFISSMSSNFTSKETIEEFIGNGTKVNSSCSDNDIMSDQFCSTYLFWAKAWSLVGDVYVEFHMIKGNETLARGQELKMSSEVVKEVKRLKKKLGQPNCSSCSLVNCSCKSDRVSSGSSASSSSCDKEPAVYGRKQTRRAHSKRHEDDHVQCNKVENRKIPLINSRGSDWAKKGGIFEYLGGPVAGEPDHNLSAALQCYEEARKVLFGVPSGREELSSVFKKKGWVCNELGRGRVERKELEKAELAFADAIEAFRQVSDHTNIILIYCNLGHGRRALAEEMAMTIQSLKAHAVLHNAYIQALDTAKLEYGESLRYYGAAKAELSVANTVPFALRNEVLTQFANTYLRVGMLLAREDTDGEVFENRAVDVVRKHEISANEAIREALSMYESLGEARRQEAAFAYFQLACYQREHCLKFVDSLPEGASSIPQRAKQYASLAERNWQKSVNFYGPTSHPSMYLTVLMERSDLLMRLSGCFHSNATQMLESALSLLLKGRHVTEIPDPDFLVIVSKFWRQLQALLKNMLSVQQAGSSGSKGGGDVGKLRELYKMSLKVTELSQLQAMHGLWES